MSDKRTHLHLDCRGGIVLYLVLAFGVVAIGLASHMLARHFSPAAGAVFFVSMLAWGISGIFLLSKERAPEETDDQPAQSNRAPRPAHQPAPQPVPERAPQPSVMARTAGTDAERQKSETAPDGPVDSGFEPIKHREPAKPAADLAQNLPPPEPPLVLTREERYAQYLQEDFRESIAAGVNQLSTLVESTKHKLGHYQHVMGKRMHKTSGTEHRSLISARKMVELLEERRDGLKAALEAYENGRASRDEVFGLLYDDLVIPYDPVTALPEEKPIPPVPREQWEAVVDMLCRQVARKPSFLQLLRSELLSGVSRRT